MKLEMKLVKMKLIIFLEGEFNLLNITSPSKTIPVLIVLFKPAFFENYFQRRI